jgi:hypothetical protein
MADIHHKSPSQQRKRWWTIPIPTAAYKAGYARIFGPKKPTEEDIEAAQQRLDNANHNDCIGGHREIDAALRNLRRLLELRDGK